MKKSFLLTLLLITLFISMEPAIAQSTIPPAEKQIKAALSPAPADMRDEATVMGYNQQEEFITLREGSNELICLADDPKADRFHVACYYKDLEPFMKRGRELRREGMEREQIMETRRREIESGDLHWPQKPMALYSLSGSENGYDYSSEQLRSASPLYVVYIPYATEESTGIAAKPASEGAPWLMNPGEPWAHIMISTGRMMGEDSLEN